MNPIAKEWLTRPEGLATRIRTLRERAGLSGKEFAGRLGWDPTRLSKLERGNQMPTAADVRVIAEALDQLDLLDELLALRDDARTFAQRMRDGQESVQRSYTDMVRDASVIRYFEVAYMPGFVQIEPYMRRVLEEQRDLHGVIDDVDKAMAQRRDRWEILHNDASKRFEFLLTEAVLRWRLCPPGVMARQLDRLMTVEAMDNVRLGVVPFDAVLPTTPQSKFELYDDVVAVEVAHGDEVYDDADVVAFYKRLMDRLWDEAVEGDEARQLIVSAAQSLQ